MSMLEDLGKAITVQEEAPKPQRRKRTQAEKLESEKRAFCNAARKMLVQIDKKQKTFQSLIVNSTYTNTSAVQSHLQVLERLKTATNQAKDAFECGD